MEVFNERFLLIVFRDTSPTTSAMFAPQRFPDHARNAKVLLIKFPIVNELADDLSLLVPASEFRHITRILSH